MPISYFPHLQRAVVIAATGLLFGFDATAADPAASSAPAKPIIALVSAMGDTFTVVRNRDSVGSNIIDRNARRTLKVGNALNMSVLAGLDRQVARTDPESERIFLTLNAVELENVLPQDREKVAIGKLVSALEKMPARLQWDRILVATPRFQYSEREGMGAKLQGLGVYIQPLTSGSFDGVDLQIDGTAINQQNEEKTATPSGKRAKSTVYVAPFSYITVYTLDAKTLKVLSTNSRYDYVKLSDPDSTALDVEQSITPQFLAERMIKLVERSAARGAGEAEDAGQVEIGEIKQVSMTVTPATDRK